MRPRTIALALLFLSCSPGGVITLHEGPDATAGDSSVPPAGAFCALPGSVIVTAHGQVVVPGSTGSTPDLSWLGLPVGFCAHYFARVNVVRQLRFAPGGDLFAASPSTFTPGGGSDGVGAIFVLPDDDRDGVADANIAFFSGIASTQGLLFANGHFYFQDSTTIRRLPFNAGDRQPSGAIEAVTTITAPQASDHWSKVLDIAQDGTIYISNGSTQSEQCLSTRLPVGAIFKLEPDGSTSEVAKGFRNPIAMRCEVDHDVCLVVELARDGSGARGGREKLVPVRAGDDWGFPCCAAPNLAYSDTVYKDTNQPPDCSGVVPESASFIVGDTPFGLDFERGKWPPPWAGRVFVALHGVVGSWSGARVVAVPLDPATGLPLEASDIQGSPASPDNMLDFATGWDDGRQDHGRPAPVAFAPDGRLFVGDDRTGVIVWIAPTGLVRP